MMPGMKGQPDIMREDANGHHVSTRAEAQHWLSSVRNIDESPVAVMLVGIRDLKQVNAYAGHERGDRLILQVGDTLVRHAAHMDADVKMVAHMTGREFLMIMTGPCRPGTLERHGEALMDLLSADFGTEGEPLFINPRIALATGQADETGMELLHRAEQALAAAYTPGGSKMVVAPYEKNFAMAVHRAIDGALRDALRQKTVSIMLQPQFRVDDGALYGAEALARLHHPGLGEIGAAQLFAAADRCDLRAELSGIILSRAIEIVGAWPASLGNLRIALNLGAEELGDGYGVRLLSQLQKNGVAPERLTLELTEESLVRDLDVAATQLQELRGYGIRIALDDFGTGYSSLAYLKMLPLDYLKIDKDMTADIVGNGRDKIILRAIIALAKALNLQIIAEGVEYSGELELLKLEGCDYYQGFLAAPPLSPEKFEQFAAEWK